MARARGKHIALQIALVFAALTTAGILILPAQEFIFAAPAMAAAGLTNGGGVLLTRALMADVVDEDELRTGTRRSGLFFSVLLTTSKFGVLAGPMTYIILELAGFVAALGPNNSEQALAALSTLFIAVPIVLYALAALSLRKYPLDEKAQAELHAAIAARHAAVADVKEEPSPIAGAGATAAD